MSSKGQVVIPEEIRDSLNLEAGSKFAVFGNRKADAILLKRLVLPDPARTFSEMAKWGRQHAKEKGLNVSPETIVEKQHKRRLEQHGKDSM